MLPKHALPATARCYVNALPARLLLLLPATARSSANEDFLNNTRLPATATACYCQELCEGDLNTYLKKVKDIIYDKAGNPWLLGLAPLLMDVCRGMLYLHTCNIVHGGRRSMVHYYSAPPWPPLITVCMLGAGVETVRPPWPPLTTVCVL